MKTKDGIRSYKSTFSISTEGIHCLGELTNFPPFILVPPDAIASEIFTMILVIALSSWFTSKFMFGSRALNVCRNMPLLLGFSCWVHGEMPVLSSVLE